MRRSTTPPIRGTVDDVTPGIRDPLFWQARSLVRHCPEQLGPVQEAAAPAWRSLTPHVLLVPPRSTPTLNTNNRWERPTIPLYRAVSRPRLLHCAWDAKRMTHSPSFQPTTNPQPRAMAARLQTLLSPRSRRAMLAQKTVTPTMLPARSRPLCQLQRPRPTERRLPP